jgi:hypothetical protein
MTTKAMHLTMIDQLKVFTDTIQNAIIMHSRKEQKEDIWDLHITNKNKLL